MEDPQCTAGSFAQCKTILCNALSTLDFAKCIFFKLDNEQLSAVSIWCKMLTLEFNSQHIVH